ncbi:MAG: ornithine cyclodeaminase family protein [Burkholderiaceae bacterium]
MKLITESQIAKVTHWPLIIDALRAGHLLEPAKLGDTLLSEGDRKMLVRSAWVPGVGAGVKAVTVFPDNPARSPSLPSVQGQVLLFDRETGAIAASLPGEPITQWKTAGDSALGSQLLSRPDSRVMLMIGAGAMAEPLIRAHLSVRPAIASVLLFNRSAPRVGELARRLTDLAPQVSVVTDLAQAVARADIVCCATLSVDPLIEGRWLKPGTHVDLVGAYTPQMREADDAVLQRSRVFVDSFETTVGHIGEIQIPLDSGALRLADIQGDLYALVQGRQARNHADEITVFKNGGGAHLDVIVASAIAAAATTD